MWSAGAVLVALTGALIAATGRAFVIVVPRQATFCPGYSISNVQSGNTGLTADLSLAGPACNSFGSDIPSLKLMVNYDTAKRLHVKIQDSPAIAYTVPESIFPYPPSDQSVSADEAELEFTYQETPFSFRVVRKANSEVLFDSSAESLIFQDEYLRLRTALPANPNLYGLGEHADDFKLGTTGYTRTLWSRDSYGIPEGTNLYGNHPVYFDHRGASGTHGVYLHSSAGMDVKIDQDANGQQYLEYNLMSGIIDLFFMAGPTPTEVSKQYAEVAGLPAEVPYWSFGLHQCRYGYRDFYGVAEVVANYSAAGIPLETMWTDIDYMYERFIMTTDPDRFPIDRVREIVNYLHEHNQHYIVMVDPAVAYQEQKYDNLTYTSFTIPRDNGYFVYKNGSVYKGVVWPGVTAFPDWFHPEVQQWWNDEFASFFDANTGIDIDGLWIDMNEAANFNFFGDIPEETQEERNFPPLRPALRSQPRPIPGFPETFQPGAQPYPPDDYAYAPPWLAADSNPNDNGGQKKKRTVSSENSDTPKRQVLTSPSGAQLIGYPERDFLAPPYQIDNANTYQAVGGLSNFTLDTDIIHYDGHVELDVHNLYGSQMSEASRTAMLARRPGRRPLVITRSTFAGVGRSAGKWLGDNLSIWDHYRNSIQGMLNFAALFQVPMVGSDICGFGGNTTETLCARWASLGAFYTFARNHNSDTSLPQEFFLWDTVAEAARNALDIRYRLLDYIYTGFHQQTLDGTPVLQPLWFQYPTDSNTFANQLQFFYGNSLLISPVTEENSTSVTIYLPNDRFYTWNTWQLIESSGQDFLLTDIPFTAPPPIHVRGGSILPMRQSPGYTTSETKNSPLELLVAPGREGGEGEAPATATGSLYLDDGDSLIQPLDTTSEISFFYEASSSSTLFINGTFAYPITSHALLASVMVLGVSVVSETTPTYYKSSTGTTQECEWWTYDAATGVMRVGLNEVLNGEMVVYF